MSSTPTNQSLSVAPPPSRVRRVFFGANGIRSGWRFLIFVLLLGTCLIAVRQGLMHIPTIAALFAEAMKGTLTPGFEFIFESTAIAGLFGVTFLMAKIEKRPFRQYGLPLKGAFGKLFWQGVVWGLAFMSIEIFAIYALHGFSFGGLAIVGFELVSYAMAWAVGFVLVGIFEEFTFRGYAQFVLSEGIGSGLRPSCSRRVSEQCISKILEKVGWEHFQSRCSAFSPVLPCAAPAACGLLSDSTRLAILRKRSSTLFPTAVSWRGDAC